MRSKRCGFTLFEMVLVMAVLVVIVGLSLPYLEGMLSAPQVLAGQDMVRARLADVRGRAMKEGRSYKFSFIEKTGRFRIEPEDDAAGEGDAAPLVLESELPENLFFAKGAGDLAGGVLSPGSNWEVLAVFLPDGTARDDNVIYVGAANESARGVRIRALLGQVSAFDPRQEGNP